tara:strand:+ start:500 stop:934 length:435 start_codon:yes stop_codon:yes gene_type:complete
MENSELDYMAGFFDGEGCISINKSNKLKRTSGKRYLQYSAVIVVSNTDRDVLEIFQRNFGGNIYTLKRGLNAHKYKPCYQWMAFSNQAKTFCLRMVDRLILKRKQAEIIITLQNMKNGKWKNQEKLDELEAMKLQINKLNKRGT